MDILDQCIYIFMAFPVFNDQTIPQGLNGWVDTLWTRWCCILFLWWLSLFLHCGCSSRPCINVGSLLKMCSFSWWQAIRGLQCSLYPERSRQQRSSKPSVLFCFFCSGILLSTFFVRSIERFFNSFIVTLTLVHLLLGADMILVERFVLFPWQLMSRQLIHLW